MLIKHDDNKSNLRLINATATLGFVVLLVFILHVGKNLILPLIIALVIWYIIIQFTKFFHKIKIHNKNLPYSIALIFSIVIALAILYLFILLITSSIGNIIAEAPKYQAKLKTILIYLNRWTHNRLDVMQLLGQIDLTKLFSMLAIVISNLLSNFVLIMIYLLFLLLETKTFDNKLKGICQNQSQYLKVSNIIWRIHTEINTFLKAKTALNAIAGIASYICLLFFHVDYAEFWGMLIFLLHFIPFLGPILAVLFVMLAVSVQINSLLLFTLLAAILITIQFVVGNLLEPRWVGSRLNLSPMVILISLAFWGYLWGIVGMFLCVPMMVIINIILANFQQTRSLAIMLSADWHVIKTE